MNSTLSFILILLFGFSVTLIGVFKDYRDKRYTKQWWKQIKKEGYLLLIIGLLIIGVSIYQYDHEKKEKHIQDDLAKKEVYIRDSTLKAEIAKGVDANRKTLFQDLSKALGKQMLKLDTVNKELVRMQGTSHDIEPPFLTMATPKPFTVEDVTDTTYKITANFYCQSGVVSDINVFISVISQGFDGGFSWGGKHKQEFGDATIAKFQQFSKDMELRPADKTAIKNFYFMVKGSYKDREKRNTYNIDVIFQYEMADPKPLISSGSLRKRLLEFAEKHKKEILPTL